MRREAPRRGKWDFCALRAREGGSENTKSENFLEGGFFGGEANAIRLLTPPSRARRQNLFAENFVISETPYSSTNFNRDLRDATSRQLTYLSWQRRPATIPGSIPTSSASFLIADFEKSASRTNSA